ncbi:hypothetical protein G7046_g9142 [Stylonectria norvegica]|nr:hypothetical protein G7046_g9142 [Stylonectria norvegica]
MANSVALPLERDARRYFSALLDDFENLVNHRRNEIGHPGFLAEIRKVLVGILKRYHNHGRDWSIKNILQEILHCYVEFGHIGFPPSLRVECFSDGRTIPSYYVSNAIKEGSDEALDNLLKHIHYQSQCIAGRAVPGEMQSSVYTNFDKQLETYTSRSNTRIAILEMEVQATKEAAARERDQLMIELARIKAHEEILVARNEALEKRHKRCKTTISGLRRYIDILKRGHQYSPSGSEPFGDCPPIEELVRAAHEASFQMAAEESADGWWFGDD